MTAPQEVQVDEPEQATGQRAGRRGRATWFFTVVGIVVVVALMVGGLYAWRLWSAAAGVDRDASLLPSGGTRPAGVTGSLNYVLMGSDARSDDEQGRSDVLMVAHVPPTHDRVYLISFPRDMWVEIPGHGHAKINAAFAYGGDALTAATLESLIGVRLDHAVKIDFEGFAGLTTQVGGVTLDNKVASSSGQYHWPEGEITLSGQEALAYVRQRYELPNGDLDRAERQRAMVKALLQNLLSLDVLTNPVVFDNVEAELSRYVTVDSELTPGTIFATATSMRIGGHEDILLLQAPISGFGRSEDGQAIDYVNEAQLAELAQAIRTGTMDRYYETYREQAYVTP